MVEWRLVVCKPFFESTFAQSNVLFLLVVGQVWVDCGFVYYILDQEVLIQRAVFFPDTVAFLSVFWLGGEKIFLLWLLITDFMFGMQL